MTITERLAALLTLAGLTFWCVLLNHPDRFDSFDLLSILLAGAALFVVLEPAVTYRKGR